MATKINVGLNRRVRMNHRWRIEHSNARLEIDAEWGAEDFTHKVTECVARACPGWNITGYALAGSKSFGEPGA